MRTKGFSTNLRLAALAALFTAVGSAQAGPTKVGNGDDGTDLEGLAPVKEGAFVVARDKAVQLLESTGTSGVAGLGQLLPEVRDASLWVAARDVAPSGAADEGGFHSDMRGLVFARTFAEPHAATRFFPIAAKLDEQQLVALHIHEALHRALPPAVRENESVVSQITLAITSPGATRDRIAQATAKHLPSINESRAVAAERYPIPETAAIRNPSLFAYTYRNFAAPKGMALYPVGAMHTIQSFLYPFGDDRNPLGIGIEAALITHEGRSLMGPLSLSGRMRLWSGRGFDVGAWAVASLNTLSAEELRASPMGRDVLTAGLSMRKDLAFLYFENFVSLSSKGESRRAVGPYEYTYSYGTLTQVSMHAGAALSKLKLGVYAEIGLADYFRVDGPDFPNQDLGRIRLVSGGPEITWMEKEFAVSLIGRAILGSNREMNYDQLGNLMGQGSGQGFVSGTLSFYF